MFSITHINNVRKTKCGRYGNAQNGLYLRDRPGMVWPHRPHGPTSTCIGKPRRAGHRPIVPPGLRRRLVDTGWIHRSDAQVGDPGYLGDADLMCDTVPTVPDVSVRLALGI